MSEPKRDDEPTMEEILASIRKIISEDDPETAEVSPEDGAGAGIGEQHEPMELTQMVSEDGSVVDLRSDQAVGPVSLQEVSSGETAIVEPLVPEDTRVHAELIGDDDSIEPEAEAREVVAVETATEIVAESEPEFAAEPEPEFVAESEPEIAAAPEPEIAAAPELEIAAEPEPDSIPEVETAQVAPAESGSPLESLVSAKAAAAATAAMTRLNASLASESAAAGSSDKTLEALVRETIAPHLKAWLNENLPELVERIVREEIERIVGRADIR